MRIKERLVRQAPEDTIEIGRIIKNAYYGKFGEILKAMIEGLMTEGLTINQVNPSDRMPISADRLLGRLEGYQTIVNKLELAIEEAEDLQRPIKEED